MYQSWQHKNLDFYLLLNKRSMYEQNGANNVTLIYPTECPDKYKQKIKTLQHCHVAVKI